MRRRLAELRGPDVAPRALDARALAALAANPGCRRRALLDGAGVDKGALARALGAPAPFGQSQFAFSRGHAFEARVKGDGGGELMRLVHARTGAPGTPPPEPDEVTVPDLTAAGPAGRAERTALALERATADGGWTLLDHPMLELEVAGSPVYLEPDAVAVHPDGRRTVVEIKSFPILDGSADPAKVGAAARQAAVYALALEPLGGRVDERALLVCPKDFSNLPTAEAVDLRRQRATTRRQLARLTRLEEIAAALPEGVTFAPDRPPDELADAVRAVPAAYAPQCLSTCELAFHCRERARAAGAVEVLGREVRGELGELTTLAAVLAAAHSGPDGSDGSDGASGDGPDDPSVAALRRAARLRAEALSTADPTATVPPPERPRCP
ncbi:hypothetical protein F0L17_08560 [Streptomyces sp. TRM43335]|uniref:Secreted protein n=1 Tax=Streptomyces taklimakanensis TaxID=2569853 RepID=A0A6G2BAT1_9ACTN|nr:hypothetical protein [Streptomyces taklimakanensis]MTE19179.1 hypothetical protein [Streptomyces taklimakanensis]